MLVAPPVVAATTIEAATSTERDWSQSDVRMRDTSTSSLITARVTITDPRTNTKCGRVTGFNDRIDDDGWH